MPLSLGDIAQSTSGSTGAAAAATTFSPSLPSGTTAGNTVIIGVAYVGGGTSSTMAISGFTKDATTGAQLQIFRKSNVGAAETSWSGSINLASRFAWVVLEIANLDLSEPLDASITTTTAANPQTSGTTTTNSALDTIVLAFHSGTNSAGTAPTFSAQTNSFTELAEGATSTASANVDIAGSYLFPGTIGTFSSSATRTGTTTASNGAIVVYRSATSPSASTFAYHTSFDFAHAGGASVGPVAARLVTSAQGATIAAGSAYTGTHGLRLTASAAQSWWYLTATTGNILPASKDAAVIGARLRVVSATGTVVLASMTDMIAGVGSLELVYNATTTKLGLRWQNSGGAAGGTISYQAGTLALNTWARVSVSYRGTKGTTRDAAWTVDGVAETAPAQATGLTAQPTGVNRVGLGNHIGTDTYTYTADFDDFRVSQNPNNHPLGDDRVELLGVDTGGTVTLSGTTTNFQTFAGATPTLTAWNATTARNAVDEVPPGLGASADGFAQVLAAASDYVEVPMSTYTLAAGEMILGVRVLVAGWAAGASTIGLRGFDGTTETVLWAVADPSFNNSSTAPGWLSCPWFPGGRWTQAKLDAAALRLGFGTSATDIGAHALYLEVVIGTATTQTLFGDQAAAAVDPSWSALTEIDVAPPVGGPASLYYETNTTPTTVVVDQDTAHTETIDAPDAATTNYVALYFPPEGVPDA